MPLLREPNPSSPLPVTAAVGRYPTAWLIGRPPFRLVEGENSQLYIDMIFMKKHIQRRIEI